MRVEHNMVIGGVSATLRLEVRPEAYASLLQGLESRFPDSQTASDTLEEAFHRTACAVPALEMLQKVRQEFHQLLAAHSSEMLLAMVKGDDTAAGYDISSGGANG